MTEKQESSFHELALNIGVNQERNCKEGKGQATLDYWLVNSLATKQGTTVIHGRKTRVAGKQESKGK